MLEFTPKLMMLAWALVGFVLFANYPVVTIFVLVYYMLIVPSWTYVVAIVGLVLLLEFIFEALGENFFRGVCKAVIIMFVFYLLMTEVLDIDLQSAIGKPMHQALTQLKGGMIMAIEFVTSFIEAELRVGFSLEFIIQAIVPIYFIYHICLFLLSNASVLSDRTCIYLALVMSFIGARGGVLNGIIAWIETRIFNVMVDPLTFSLSLITLAFILIAVDAIIDVLFYVMSVSPEERKKYWKDVMAGKASKFSSTLGKFQNMPKTVKSAKLKMMDPGRIASNFAQSARMSTLQMRQPTGIDRQFGNLRRGAFSAAPVYNTIDTGTFRGFFNLGGGGK